MIESVNNWQIKKTFHLLPVWSGEKITDTYGNKQVLDDKGMPVFAELFALGLYAESGYNGVWADTYRKKFRTELPEKNEVGVELPDFVKNTLHLINPDRKLTGTWDLILWKNREIRFVELKRKGKDSIRQTQIDFLARALRVGIPLKKFEIFEWTPVDMESKI